MYCVEVAQAVNSLLFVGMQEHTRDSVHGSVYMDSSNSHALMML